MELPKDPAMLLSLLNMKLRNAYPSLDALCDDMGLSKADIVSRMEDAGFEYDERANRFW